MGYKLVFNQMFDVRPRKGSGDLDLEKIEKIKAILDLRYGQLPKTERIIDLKPKRCEEPFVFEKESAGASDRANLDFWPEFLYAEAPERREIVSILDLVEATEKALKKQRGDENINKAAVGESLGIDREDKLTELSLEKQAETEVKVPVIIAEPPVEDLKTAEEVMPQEPLPQAENSVLAQEVTEAPLEVEGSILAADDDIFFQIPEAPPYKFQPQNFYFDKNTDFGGDAFLAPELSSRGMDAGRQVIDLKRRKKPLLVFAAAAILVFLAIPAFGWVNKALTAKDIAFDSGLAAYQALEHAKEALEQLNFPEAKKNFEQASRDFASVQGQISGVGGWLVDLAEKIPIFSYFSSRTRLVKVGQGMSKAGEDFTSMIGLFERSRIPSSENNSGRESFSETIQMAKTYLASGLDSLIFANENLGQIKADSLPQGIQPQVVSLSQKLPEVIETTEAALSWTDKFLSILGHERSKKYLLIFQNNAEMRPTGGFVGTYGILGLDRGEIKKLFVDGIFNPDGQLSEKIVPPKPIQKISTAWSMHDANWFFDFPTSAKKIMWFWEHTGGETVDGVIALTPTVVERLLKITGPIDLPQYGVTLDENNFVELTQYKVEVDYDKELNQPKKILADFAPIFLEKLRERLPENNFEVVKAINQALKEKHILLYFSDEELERFVRDQGWAGDVLSAPGDYLAVVNTNINGYKTDRFVKEDIKLTSEIAEDGAVISTLRVTRRHNGGTLPQDWYNKVNSDYLRVYVPKGSQLISASGQTKETIKSPVDYDALGFKRDADVTAQENSLKTDDDSGTQIFEESGKTVFSNWVYVSPGEEVTVTYIYRLPFKLDLSKSSVNFGLLAQKQSGSIGSGFSAEILPPKNCITNGYGNIETDLSVDRQLNFELQCANK